MEKKCPYDYWLLWRVEDRCNLNCEYCFPNTIKSSAEVSEINISDLTRTLNATNKTFLISFTGGGEPFLVPNIIEACREITKNHYISFNTNLTAERVEGFCEEIEPQQVLYIIAALHIEELEKRNLLEKYIRHFKVCQKKGFNIIANEVAYPPLLDKVQKYRDLLRVRGIHLTFSPFIGKYDGKVYPDSYVDEEYKTFGLDRSCVSWYRQKGKLCNAGYNVAVVNRTGEIRPCLNFQEILGSIYDSISFKKNILRCQFDSCESPLNVYEPDLYQNSLKRTRSRRLISSLFHKIIHNISL